MRSIIVCLLLLGVIVSGCIQNPLEQVPVVKVNITFGEKEGYVFKENITLKQATVDYAARPRQTIAESFPAISARTSVVRNNSKPDYNATSPWETLQFKGPGTYNFKIGFNEKFYPETGDLVHVTIFVVNETGKRIGYHVEDRIWGVDFDKN